VIAAYRFNPRVGAPVAEVTDDAARDRLVRGGTWPLALLTVWASRGAAKVNVCLAERPAGGEELTGDESCLAWFPSPAPGPGRGGGPGPPGQYLTDGFPVLSAGPAPHTPLEEWTFSITQGGQTGKSWRWQEFRALPAETITADIHCVTRWSKLGTQWRGVSVDMLLDRVEHDAPYVMAFGDGGYTTNLSRRTG